MTAMKLFDQQFLDELSAKARAAPRLRVNHNVHEQLDEPVQRLFIAIEPGSYVRPHRHPEPEKWELFLVLRGKFAALLFDAEGEVLRREELSSTGPVLGFEVPPDTWHSLVALESGSIFFEVKRGPYTPLSDKDFAAWAPAEGDAACAEFVQWLVAAQPGELPPTV
jgi:cupin fold WbuC family metalloprotein